MSRCEFSHTSTFSRAGFYLPFSGAAVFPDREAFLGMSGDYNYVPLYSRSSLDLDVVDFFEKIIADNNRPFCLLESLTGSDNGRYSIIALNPLLEIITHLNNPQGIEPLRNFFSTVNVPELDFPFFTGGLLGYWTYESGLQYQCLETGTNDFPEQYFFMPEELLVYDRQEKTLSCFIWTDAAEVNQEKYQEKCQRLDDLFCQADSCQAGDHSSAFSIAFNQDQIDLDFKVNIEKKEFYSMVEKAREHICQGDIFQIVLSRRWQKASSANPWEVYLNLRQLNPSPYMFYFKLPDFILMGASPEMQVKVEKGRIKSRPIAGTRKVSGDEVRDGELARELLVDEKERAEHLMLVDLSRNDIGRVSKAASVRVNDFMKIERYSHVMHIVSSVEGELKGNNDALEAFQACFPAGTLSGAPKRRAMEIIRELENHPRGPYGGAAGHISFDGSLDSCISIRAILYEEGKYYLQSGAGIVADSVPENEEKETLHKARALMLAIKEAEK